MKKAPFLFLWKVLVWERSLLMIKNDEFFAGFEKIRFHHSFRENIRIFPKCSLLSFFYFFSNPKCYSSKFWEESDSFPERSSM